MTKYNPVSSHLILLFILSRLMLTTTSNKSKQHHQNSTSSSSLPPQLLSLDLATRLSFDSTAINSASTDFGKLIETIPAAVLYPSSIQDIETLVRFSYNSSTPFTIAAKGHGHSVRGQAMAHNGIVVNMRSLASIGNRINISQYSSSGGNNYYAVDVGGEQLWIDVLHKTLEHGLTPRSWTDYLYLTVGGTLSNAGMSGQTFRYGPQISNVYEMDVINGKGETVTCSKQMNSELFFAVLGGLGQFGIITRARIALQPAPQRVRWVRMLYDDFTKFTRDQEHLISIIDDDEQERTMVKGFDYVEGSLMLHQSPANNWRSSFFSSADYPRIAKLTTKNSIIYCLEVAKYYDDHTVDAVNQELEFLLGGLSYISGFKFTKDISYLDFLNRVRSGELKLQSEGLWDVPHPWLNLFVPKSQIADFNSRVFHGIILQEKKPAGLILVYPTNRNKWDEYMSAIVPDEDVFYSVGLLQSSGLNDWEYLEDQNKEILQACEKYGIKIKQYLPHYNTKAEWKNHFGSKWKLFQGRKATFDPKALLSPGQRIFTSKIHG